MATVCIPQVTFEFQPRRKKRPCFLPVQVRPGELSVHPSSYRGGKEGNQAAEAFSGHGPTSGGSASRRAATRVKPEQASKVKS